MFWGMCLFSLYIVGCVAAWDRPSAARYNRVLAKGDWHGTMLRGLYRKVDSHLCRTDMGIALPPLDVEHGFIELTIDYVP